MKFSETFGEMIAHFLIMIEIVRGMTINQKCQTPINILSAKGAYIEPLQKSRVRIDSLKKPFGNGHALSFDFKTTSLSGVLFYLNNANTKEFVGVEIASGFLTYHIKCRRLEAVLTVAAAKVDDGKWHSIVYRRKRKRGRLIVDGKHYFQNYRIACDNEGFASMTLGGIHPVDIDFVDSFEGKTGHFEGCIKNVDNTAGILTLPKYTGVSECE
ncbi:laminin subunit alpha-4-like [Mytilus californianus]|uniref:laminin subunit alpha-4-like n=1 Tax=Mytilus californianus TaxID=6549 RepID=UPI00224749DE|nr:laminin subunit alpha-4-like [Mytilus californianus]